MQDTGIVRRIDDLGRVVIPKEMRKTLRIKEGDPLEIYTNKEELIFKKFSPIGSVSEYSQAIVEGISKITEKDCAATDTDAVVFASGKLKELVGKRISEKLGEAIKERKSLILSSGDGELISISSAEEKTENQVIVPIISGGDCYGALIMSDADKESRFNSNDVKLVQFGAYVLAKQFE